MLKLELTEQACAALLTLCEAKIKGTALELSQQGSKGLGKALKELRTVSVIADQLMTALGSNAEPESEPPHVDEPEPEAAGDEPGSPDDAPPAAVVAARRTTPKKPNGAGTKFVRGAIRDVDAESGP